MNDDEQQKWRSTAVEVAVIVAAVALAMLKVFSGNEVFTLLTGIINLRVGYAAGKQSAAAAAGPPSVGKGGAS